MTKSGHEGKVQKKAVTLSTSLQEKLDVLRVVHSESIAARHGVEQRGFSFRDKTKEISFHNE